MHNVFLVADNLENEGLIIEGEFQSARRSKSPRAYRDRMVSALTTKICTQVVEAAIRGSVPDADNILSVQLHRTSDSTGSKKERTEQRYHRPNEKKISHRANYKWRS